MIGVGEGVLGVDEEILSLSASCETPCREGIRVWEGVLGVDKGESTLIAFCAGHIEGMLALTTPCETQV